MRYLSDQHHFYLIGTPYAKKDEIKNRLSATWADRTKREGWKGWKIPRNLFAYREAYVMFKEFALQRGDFMRDYEAAYAEVTRWLDFKSRENLVIDSRLREYQNQDAAYLKARGSALVLNEPRTGKTPTTICTVKALYKKKNIVICPSSLVYNWKKEFEQWYPECMVFAVNGTPKQRENIYNAYMSRKNNPCVLIISKDTWKSDINKYEIGSYEFDVAIVDEAHFLRNYKSKQSEAIFNLKATTKYALTGTPAVKHAVDVYGLLHFINPKAFPSYWQFADRYFHIIEDMWGKSIGDAKEQREEELKTIMAINSVQRKRKEVMKWLPEATHQTIPVVMDKKQQKLYDQMLDKFVATMGEGEDMIALDTPNVLTQLMRLRQLCLDPRTIKLENGQVFDVVGAKTTALLEFAEDNTDPFVVMTTFSSYFKIIKPELEKLGKRVEIIDGSTPKKQKMETAEKFQKGQIDILLCNIIAAGTGFTLDRADTIVFLDKDFNPANNEQAQDRIVPTTKERYHPINIISFVVADSVDERVNYILEKKEDLTAIINKPNGLKGLLDK